MKYIRILLILTTLLFALGCGAKAPVNDAQEADTALTPPAAALDEPFPVTQEQLHEGEPMLVTDAFTYTYAYMDDDESGQSQTHEFNYAIPKFMLDSPEIRALNDEIYQMLYNAELIETVEYNNENVGMLEPYYTDISYSWAINDDVLSLVIEVSTDMEGTKGYVYNVSISQQTQLSNDALIEAYGMTQEEYLAQVKLAFSNVFWINFSDFRQYIALDPSNLGVFEDCLQTTMSEDNLLAAQPYLDREGKLNAYGYYYFPATGGQTSANVCLEDIELSPDWAEHITP